MKVIFCNFFDFFTQEQEKCGRENHNTTKKPCQISQKVAQLEDKRTHQQKIEHRAAQNRADIKDAYPAVPHRNGINKEGRGDRQPEQEIQKAAQQRNAHPDPEDAEQVVQQPHRRPQRQRARHGKGLGGNGNLHRFSGTAGTGSRPCPGRCPHR